MKQFYQKGKPLARWQLRFTGIIVLLALAINASVNKSKNLGQGEFKHNSQQYYTVIKVVDGDTIDIDKADVISGKSFTRIRLRGIDTPETKHPTQPVGYFGPEAAEFTRKTVLNKQIRIVLLENQDNRDKYGRLLAYVYLNDGRMLNKELISQGLGYVYPFYSHPLKEEFIDLEKKAKKDKAGLWRNVKPEQLPDWMQN
ncbi:MAG: thermonuclease family protein [Phycisphaerae bacterium]|nr:thermonuclease family protein [Phycisphaerae bacterium]